MNPNRLLPLAARKSGSALLAALSILAVTSLVVGAALSESRNRYRTAHQSSRWSQAAPAAEAGVELAMMSAQGNSWVADGWTAAPGAPGGPAVTKSFPLSAGVTATGNISVDVSVEKVTLSGSDWLRIRSTGRVDLAGGAVPGTDTQDVMLRKLSLQQDRITGASMGTTPQATRTIEILAEPTGKSLFVRPILLDQKFTMSGGWVDSFDSADPAKSTGSLYDVAKRQSHGNVAINDTQGASNLGGVPVYGDLAYSGAAPTNTSGVTGTITSPFNDPVSPVSAPTWTTFNPTPVDIKATMTLTGGTQASPALYKVNTVDLSAGKVLTMAPHAPGAESYIEVWVTGNFKTSGSGYITHQPGVHVTYHVEGDVTVSGSSFQNQSNIAANNTVNVISVGAASSQKVTVSGSGTFIGVINAPAAAFTVSGSANMSGAIIGKTMNISGGASVHYDEALSRIGNTASGGYRVASWLEAVR